LVEVQISTVDWQGDIEGWTCYFCGWSSRFMHESWCSLYDEEQDHSAILIALSYGDPTVAEEEIRQALTADARNAHHLSPRRVEEVVAGIYRDLGFDAVLTQASKDGGRDILLFSMPGKPGSHGIVEVKRHRDPVGVEFVRQLRGVQLREDVPLSILVSSSGFTAGAQLESRSANPRRLGYEMELREVAELLDAMDLTREPMMNVMARDRDRLNYRAWFSAQFDPKKFEWSMGNPVLRSGSDRTLAVGWWVH
jgi:HJR/Mrr/RecB family endonuclease